MFDNIQNNSIVICDNNYKIELLKSINRLVNIKFMSMDEFIKSYYFDYDEKSILYLIKKYNINYDIALEYLENLIKVEDKKYNNEKLDFLVTIKHELIENNLLIFNNKFKNYINNKEIIIYKYSLSVFEKYLLKDIDYKVIEKEDNKYSPKIYEAETKEEEVEFVARKISELINNGVDINKIKLANVSSDYINIINKIFSFYNLKINKFNNIPIISTIVGKTFYNNLSSVEEGIKSIEEYSDTDIYKRIIDICNKYIWCDDIDDLKILIEYDLNHTYIENTKYTNMIEIIDYKNLDLNDNYVFMLNFNQGIVPNIFKDEEYITDSIKPSYLDTTIEKNIKEKLDVISSIKNIKNLIITYKLKDDFNTFYPSNLIDELNYEVEKINLDYKISYSDISDKINLTKYLDELIKYGSISDNLNLLNSNYDIPYNTYSNTFTGIDKIKLQNYIENKKEFNLSYTYMDHYNRCSFRFYIDKILNLKVQNNEIGTILGNICHYILEKALKFEISIEDEVENYIEDNDIELTNSNKFFVKKLIKNLYFVLDVIRKQNSYSNLKNIETEKEIKVQIKDNINFLGFIDKVVYNTINNRAILSIIDYKTYDKALTLKYLNYGIDIQLPIYMYLSSHAFKDVKFAGFYLQNISLSNKSIEDKEKDLLLKGYSNSNKNIIKEFDSSYMDSKVIKGLKTKNDGNFYSTSLVLSDEEIKDKINQTEICIKNTVDNILEADFDINPKYDGKSIGCEYCKYKDLCFMREYDFVKINSNNKFNKE